MNEHSVTRGYILFIFILGLVWASFNGCRLEKKIDTILNKVDTINERLNIPNRNDI